MNSITSAASSCSSSYSPSSSSSYASSSYASSSYSPSSPSSYASSSYSPSSSSSYSSICSSSGAMKRKERDHDDIATDRHVVAMLNHAMGVRDLGAVIAALRRGFDQDGKVFDDDILSTALVFLMRSSVAINTCQDVVSLIIGQANSLPEVVRIFRRGLNQHLVEVGLVQDGASDDSESDTISGTGYEEDEEDEEDRFMAHRWKPNTLGCNIRELQFRPEVDDLTDISQSVDEAEEEEWVSIDQIDKRAACMYLVRNLERVLCDLLTKTIGQGHIVRDLIERILMASRYIATSRTIRDSSHSMNTLLVGDTGNGKTFMADHIAAVYHALFMASSPEPIDIGKIISQAANPRKAVERAIRHNPGRVLFVSGASEIGECIEVLDIPSSSSGAATCCTMIIAGQHRDFKTDTFQRMIGTEMRFTVVHELEPYSSSQLMEMAVKRLENHNRCMLRPEAHHVLSELLAHRGGADSVDAYTGRDIEELCNAIADASSLSEHRPMVTKDDVNRAWKKHAHSREEYRLLTGLSHEN